MRAAITGDELSLFDAEQDSELVVMLRGGGAATDFVSAAADLNPDLNQLIQMVVSIS